MNRKNDNKHTVDMLFVLTLFCAFAVCASLLIALGANVYQSTINDMNRHYTLSTASAFITEKIHQHDEVGCISIGDFQGNPALILKEQYGDTIYYDYIYSYDGYVRELLIGENATVTPDAGQKILAIKKFKIEADSDNSLTVRLIDKDDNMLSQTVYYHTN